MVIHRNSRPRGTPADLDEVRLPVLRPIVLVILALLAVFTGCIIWLQERRIDEHVRDRIAGVEALFYECLAEDSRLLGGLTASLRRDRELQRLWLAGDRAALLEYTEPLFKEIRPRCDITHLYFHSLDRTCFLRVHKPDRYGDRIDRATLKGAARGEVEFWGIELGPLGTFTLRFVHPWRIDGELAGYIELGEEIDGIVSTLKRVFDVELVTMLDKSFLDRPVWEEGMRMLGREANWDHLAHVVLNSHTFGPTVSQPITRRTMRRLGDESTLFEDTVGGRRFRCGPIVLSDATDRHVGRMVVMCDIGAEKASLRLLLIMLLGLSAAVVLTLAILFGRFLRDIERRLTAVYADLKAEIRKRRDLEGELRAHRDQLEEMVGQRTAELETANRNLSQEIAVRTAAEQSLHDLNEALQHTVAELDTANSDLKGFLHVAAHDLKAPVRAVGTLVDWIRDDCRNEINESGQAHLDLLSNRVARLSLHIDRILEYSEVSSGNGPACPVDLNRLVCETIEKIDPPPGIDIRVENELPVVMANPTRMAQIFENLLSNGVRHMGKPTGSVRVGCVRTEEGWRFHVSDTGRGIEERFVGKAFEMFQTLSPRDEVEGTGMGLTIVKRIVELHGGTIAVESVAGQGSTFTFTLRVPTVEAPAAPDLEAPHP